MGDSAHKDDGNHHTILHRVDFPPEMTVEFVTDIEGNWDYFSSIIGRSKILSFDDNDHDMMRLVLAPNSIFVHGGDAPDKGPDDIRIVKALVQLKRDYPDRVFLICGNRDVNKLRLWPELEPGETGRTANIYWDPKHKTYPKYLEEKQLEEGSISTLKWMLECTMGSPTTFETRRMELASRQQPSTDVTMISDQDVLESFRESVNPRGRDPWMLDYLRYGQLMLIIGDCIFVHGGIDETCLGQVPGQPPVKGGVEAWCQALNEFQQEMVKEFERQPTLDANRQFGGEPLKDYGVPNSNVGCGTVIYNTFAVNGNCAVPDHRTREYLANAGIQRVFTGHQPVGDAPSVIAIDGLAIFMCDTSYSDTQANKTRNPANNRGVAFSNVVLTSQTTTVTGILANGDAHGFTLSEYAILPDTLVGEELVDESWVKTVVVEEDGTRQLLVAKGEGWQVLTRRMSMEDVLSQLKRPFLSCYDHEYQQSLAP